MEFDKIKDNMVSEEYINQDLFVKMMLVLTV